MLDYIEDFTQELRIISDKAELRIGKTQQTSLRSFEVDYRIKSK